MRFTEAPLREGSPSECDPLHALVQMDVSNAWETSESEGVKERCVSLHMDEPAEMQPEEEQRCRFIPLPIPESCEGVITLSPQRSVRK